MILQNAHTPHDRSKMTIWVHDFNETTLKHFYERFTDLDADDSVKVILVMINSYGGSCDIQVAMRDLIKSASKPVATVALGMAMSSGACLLAAGTKGYRYAAPTSRLMIHEVAAWQGGKNSDIQTSAAETERLNKLFLTNLAEDMGKSYEWLLKELSKRKNTDWFFDAKQAKDMGMVDKIGIPKIVFKAKTVLE